jgi:CheY-like chemotaxis protein
MAEKGTILVVDDEPDYIAIVKAILDKEGYKVSTASNGVEAMSRVKEKRPDAVLMDRTMPEMGGDEAMTRLKEMPDTSSIPIILVTSLGKYDEISGGYSLGADAYITKPYTRSQIIQGLKLVLARRPSLSDEALQTHVVEFLEACYRLTDRTKKLVEKFAAQEELPQSKWLYQGLESRLKKEENRSGDLREAPEWEYVFRGWGVDFHNSKTGEQLSLAIGPGGRCDTFDEWRIQSYIESEAEGQGKVSELKSIIKKHSDATGKFIGHLSSQGWIERPKAQGERLSNKSIESQLEDRWMVSRKGIEHLSHT